MTIPELVAAIQEDVEWLSNSEDDEVECIPIEILEGVLSKYFNQTIKISQNGN